MLRGAALSKPRLGILGLRDYPSRGGTSRVVEDYLREIEEAYDVVVYREKDGGAKAADVHSTEIIDIPKFPLGDFGTLIFFASCAIHALLFEKFTVVHIHKVDASFCLPLLRLRFRTIVTSHESPYTRDKWSALAKAFFKFSELIMLRNPDPITCVSSKLAKEYSERTGKLIHFIPNGLRSDIPLDAVAADALLQSQGVGEGYILFSARRIMASKGCHTLLEAMRKVKTNRTVVLVGDFDQVPQYSRNLEKLAEGLDVRFLSPVERATLMGLVQKAGVFVFPSFTEGMSMMLLEVAWLGVPIIASDIPENTSVFGEDEVSYFNVGDVASLGGRLNEFERTPIPHQAKAVKAKTLVRERHQIADIAEQYADLYKSVLRVEPVDRAL